uniref:Homeobox domain-containing protein n=1 Tax=Panagrellus redivivus TaxID=6233 RepID=A0A7E4W7P6_PANRE
MIKTEYPSPAPSGSQLTPLMPYGNEEMLPVSHFFQQLTEIADERYEAARSRELSTQLEQHRMRHLLFEAFTTVKNRMGPILIKQEQPSENAELLRLDNMLTAENVMGPEKDENTSDNITDQTEYKDKLKTIRKEFETRMEHHNYKTGSISSDVVQLLKQHSRVRPISSEDVDKWINALKKKFHNVEMQLKQTTCEEVMSWKARFLDARRKRRNFSKQATEILQQYFNEHLSNPYPSEADKEELARRCNIKVNQVSNWFGNKRIRYKKQLHKIQDGPKPFVKQEHYHPYPMHQPFHYNMLPNPDFQNFPMPQPGFDLMNGYASNMVGDYSSLMMPPPPQPMYKHE